MDLVDEEDVVNFHLHNQDAEVERNKDQVLEQLKVSESEFRPVTRPQSALCAQVLQVLCASST